MWPFLWSTPTYGIAYFSAMIVYAVLVWRLARWDRLPPRIWIALAVSYTLTMSIGARLLYDALHGHAISVTTLCTKAFYTSGGLWGGPLLHLGLAAMLILVLTRRRSAAFDLVALSMPLPLAVSKLACFCHGCCFGRPCGWPWAVSFPQGPVAPMGIPLHPTQLYDVAVLLIAFALLLRFRRGMRWSGLLLPWFLVLQGMGRFLTEFWRGDYDHRLVSGPFSESQILCLASALAGAVIICYVDTRRRRAAVLSAAGQSERSEALDEQQAEG